MVTVLELVAVDVLVPKVPVRAGTYEMPVAVPNVCAAQETKVRVSWSFAVAATVGTKVIDFNCFFVKQVILKDAEPVAAIAKFTGSD
jgi:hypothetical protein